MATSSKKSSSAKTASTESKRVGRNAKTGEFVTTVSSKNQVTLSHDVRSVAGIQAGSNVIVTPLGDGRIMIREKGGKIVDLRGAAVKTPAKKK